MQSATYPPALRSIFKAVPCLVMCLTASTVFWVYNYSIKRHTHDHVERASYRSTRMENALRGRDNTIRQDYTRLLEFNPNKGSLH